MNTDNIVVRTRREGVLATNVVLRNTYLLLSLTLLFSAACAGLAVVTQAPYPGLLVFFIGAYGLMFLTTYLRNSPWGLVAVFAFTGFMGYTLGPMLSFFLASVPNGAHIILMSLGATGLIFMGLSGYVMVSHRDFSFLGGFLFVGFWALLVGIIAGLIWHLTIIQTILSVAFIIFASMAIIFETDQIICGGQTNYILATISLYSAIYNIFVSLLNLFSYNDRQ